MPREEAEVEHVRVGEEDEALFPRPPPQGALRVPVVGEDPPHPQSLGHGLKPPQLVVGQGLGGEEEEARAPLQGRLEHRDLEDQALPRRRGVGHDHVLPGLHLLQGRRLVGEGGEAQGGQHPGEGPAVGDGLGRPLREGAGEGDPPPELLLRFQPLPVAGKAPKRLGQHPLIMGAGSSPQLPRWKGAAYRRIRPRFRRGHRGGQPPPGPLRPGAGHRAGAELRRARETALAEAARRLGAGAVVSVDLDYGVLGSGNSVLMVTASGTAVKLAP